LAYYKNWGIFVKAAIPYNLCISLEKSFRPQDVPGISLRNFLLGGNNLNSRNPDLAANGEKLDIPFRAGGWT
jgi:hypothetical protein